MPTYQKAKENKKNINRKRYNNYSRKNIRSNKSSKIRRNNSNNKKIWIDDSVFFGCSEMPNEKFLLNEASKFLKGPRQSKKNIPLSFWTYGFPGSGKSTMSLNYLGLNHNYVVNSTDEVMENLDAYNRGINVKLKNGTIIGSKNMFLNCQEIAATIAEMVFSIASEYHRNLLIDIPFCDIEMVTYLKKQGYYMTGLYVMRKYKTIKKAIENRALQTGRFIQGVTTEQDYISYINKDTPIIAKLAVEYLDEFYICANDTGITFPQWAYKYLIKITPPNLQSWTKPAEHYKVDIRNINISQLKTILMVTKNL